MRRKKETSMNSLVDINEEGKREISDQEHKQNSYHKCKYQIKNKQIKSLCNASKVLNWLEVTEENEK